MEEMLAILISKPALRTITPYNR